MIPYSDIMQGQSRVGGVLLHPTSLPSGKLDEDAFRWLDFMAAAGLRVWQVLPLGVPQGNLSPYQCYSAFALNPALLDDEIEVSQAPQEDTAFQHWYSQERYWLDDYALFIVLKQQLSSHAWYEWDEPYKQRDPDALAIFQQQYAEQIQGIIWQQYRLYSRWNEIRDYALERGIYLFGDMPIFVAHDSADVWANQHYFLLDEQGMPTVVAGVPPDYFSETGQRWGNPHYDWEAMQESGFDWWLRRLENHLSLFDLVRVDHFRGLEAVWMIDANHETAEHGQWEKVRGEQLLEALQNKMGNVPIVAEDLGIITPEVNALRERFHLPGMSVLQFSFDAFDDNPHKPKNISHDRIVYTGTHDNDTTKGWFQTLDDGMQQHIMQVLAIDHPDKVTDTLIETALATQAQLSITPLQDFLQLGSDARMNIPGTVDGNWQWQFEWEQIPDNLAVDISKKMLAAGRLTD